MNTKSFTLHVRHFPWDLWVRFRDAARAAGKSPRTVMIDVLTKYLQGGDQ